MLPKALREALGQVISDQRREWRRERELIEAQAAKAIADLKAEIVEIRAGVNAAVAARLSEIKNGEPGPAGTSVTIDDVAPLVADAVARAIADLPPPPPGPAGRDADQAEIARQVAEAVAALPLPAPGPAGPPGESIDPAAIRQMVAEAVAEIPAPPAGKDGADGKDGVGIAEVNVTPDGPANIVLTDGRMFDLSALRGRDGMDGRAGRDGIDGRDGERGADGAPGGLPLVAAWVDRVHYQGDVVTHDGAVYQAACDTGRAPPHEDWRRIVAAGRDGADGQSLNVCGTWSEDGQYRHLDVVALNGGSFVARRDTPGPCPGPDWQLLASQGKAGKPGERGVAGPKGDKGPLGATVSGLSVDDEGLLTLTNVDGSTVGCDLYPLLSRLG